MSSAGNLQIAQSFLQKLASGAAPGEVAALFSENLVWEIPGDVGVLPWVGQSMGRVAVTDFLRDSGRLIERSRFDVQDLLANDDRAVVLGRLSARVKNTNRMIETFFAIILEISGTQITRFLMLEDSFATSRAARPDAPQGNRAE